MNDYERAVADSLKRKGWTVLHRGWPDLLCVSWNNEQMEEACLCKPGRLPKWYFSKPLRLFAVELKRGSDVVSAEQRQMHAVFNAMGLPCRVVKEDQVDDLLRSRGTIFTAPETKQKLVKQIEQAIDRRRDQLTQLKELLKQAHACSVLFDSEEPRRMFVGWDGKPSPTSEGLRVLPVDPTWAMKVADSEPTSPYIEREDDEVDVLSGTA